METVALAVFHCHFIKKSRNRQNFLGLRARETHFLGQIKALLRTLDSATVPEIAVRYAIKVIEVEKTAVFHLNVRSLPTAV